MTTVHSYHIYTFTPQIKGNPVHIYISHIAPTQKVKEWYNTMYMCTTFTPQIKGNPVLIYRILH